MASSEALNLEAIDKALKQHDSNCEFPVLEIRMAGFEIERLGWDEYRGIPIVADDDMGTGRFRLICERDMQGTEPDPLEIEEPMVGIATNWAETGGPLIVELT